MACISTLLAQSLGKQSTSRDLMQLPASECMGMWLVDCFRLLDETEPGVCFQPRRCRTAHRLILEAMDGFKTIPLLIIDDFMTTPISTQNAIDLFELLEARGNRAATVIASQLEPNEWYLRISGELMADSILSRTAKVARYVDIDGPDMREYFAKKKQAG